ncbi:MAG: glycosyltransferase [Spirochaetes bacterium]|nr:glycosyltransferase [Spirochaetota bacterium]
MNILLVSDTYKPQINGLVTALEIQRRSLKLKLNNITLLVPKLKKYKDKDIFTIPVLPNPLFSEYKIPSLFSLKNLYKIRKLKIDIIHTHTPFQLGTYAIMLSRILKIPIVHTYHTYFEEYMHYVKIPKKPGKIIVQLYSKWYCNQMDHVIAPSSFMKKVLQSYNIESDISVVPSGYDLAAFKIKKSMDWRKKLRIPEKAKVLLYVGRIAKEKNLYFLIDVFKKLFVSITKQAKHNNLYMILTGSGPEFQPLLKYIKKNNLSRYIKMTGFVEYKKIHGIYKTGDLFVFPSKTETQGLVLIEAMLNNLPIISFYERGTKAVLPVKKSLGISPVKRDTDFIKELTFYLKEDFSRSELVKNISNYVKKFDNRIIINDLILLYKKIIKRYQVHNK